LRAICPICEGFVPAARVVRGERYIVCGTPGGV